MIHRVNFPGKIEGRKRKDLLEIEQSPNKRNGTSTHNDDSFCLIRGQKGNGRVPHTAEASKSKPGHPKTSLVLPMVSEGPL
ncbi:hypothetical protein TNCT_8241 [Trichonephila clavata]|uniref:Uncharacterized protein n=1 Tax=Trichonephila clavata TaxID=2740835 RepID=A0A8X6LH02_TRICU|nr:hypothetical protein TNCT_8241 [Trichonephila clavata]